MARLVLVMIGTLFAASSAEAACRTSFQLVAPASTTSWKLVLLAADTEPVPAQAAKPLIATVPEWKAIDDDPLASGAILRIGSSRARHGIASNLVTSKDGKLLYAGMGDRSVQIWETESGKLVRRFKPLAQRINWLAVTPDGKTIAAAATSSIHLWDTGNPSDTPRTLQGHQNEVFCVAFSSDGRTLLSGALDRKARLWDVQAGKPIREINADADNALCSVAFARDDQSFFTGSYTGRIIQWKTDNGEKIREWKGPREIAQLHVLPDGKTLAAIAYREGTYIWDLKRPDTVKHLPAPCGYGAFSPDGTRLASCAQSFPADAPLKMMDLTTDKELLALPGHRGGTTACVFAPDGKTLTTYGNDHTLRRWDLATGKEIGIIAGHQNRVTGARFTNGGEQIVTCSQDGTVRFWDAVSGKELLRLSAEGEHFDSLAISPDGKTLAISGSPIATRWRWELPPDKRVFNLRIWNIAEQKEENRWYVPGHSAYELHFMPDGRELLSVGYGRVVFHDLKTGKERRPIPDAQQNLRCAAVSPDGKTVAIATDEPAIRQIAKVAYYDAATGRESFSRTIAFTGVNGLAFSPNGKQLALTSVEGMRKQRSMSLWDATNGNELRGIPGSRSDVAMVAWSPDGRLLAAVDPEGITIFEAITGQERWRFVGGHTESIRALAFSPDSRKMVTASDDTLVTVWDLTGLIGRKIEPLEARELDAAWSALADMDGNQGGKMIARLSSRPAEAIPYLRVRLGLISNDDRKRIDALVEQLDHDQFRVRDKAAKELELIGDPAVPALARALERTKSEEMRTQAERLLKKIGPGEDPATSATARRLVRAVEALERAGTPEAIALLRDLAALGQSRLMHDEASAALRRQSIKP